MQAHCFRGPIEDDRQINAPFEIVADRNVFPDFTIASEKLALPSLGDRLSVLGLPQP